MLFLFAMIFLIGFVSAYESYQLYQENATNYSQAVDDYWVYINYSKPYNFDNNFTTNASWAIKYSWLNSTNVSDPREVIVQKNLTIPDYCFNNVLQLRLRDYWSAGYTSTANFQCYNNSLWVDLENLSNYWNCGSKYSVGCSFPSNPQLTKLFDGNWSTTIGHWRGGEEDPVWRTCFWVGSPSGSTFGLYEEAVIWDIFIDNLPSVILNSPSSINATAPQTYNFSCSAFDDVEIKNVTLWINNIENFTVIGNSTNSTELFINQALSEGNYTIYCTTTDSANNEAISDTHIINLEAYVEETPAPQVQGVVYQSLAESGAGLGILMQYLSRALPTLLIMLAMAIIIGAIGFGIAHAIKNYLK